MGIRKDVETTDEASQPVVKPKKTPSTKRKAAEGKGFAVAKKDPENDVPVPAPIEDEEPETVPTKSNRPPLARMIKAGEPKEVYVALCEDVAERMAITTSGRDYAAMSKSFITAYENLLKAISDEGGEADEVITSPIVNLQMQMQSRNVKVKVMDDDE